MDQALLCCYLQMLPIRTPALTFLFFWVKKHLGFFSVSTIAEELMNLIS